MKKIYFLAFFLFASNLLLCQNFIETNYKHFLDNEDITRVQISEKMFSFASALTKNIEDEEGKKAHKLVSKIKGFDLIRLPNITNANKEFRSGYQKLSDFEELIRVKDNTNNVAILVKENNDIIYELVGLIAADSEFVAFTLIGEIDLNEIGELTKSLGKETLTNIKGISNLEFDDVKVYPNPAKANSKVSVDVPQKLKGGKLTLYDLDGKLIQTQNIDGTSLEVQTNKLTAGSYMLKMENGTFTVNRKIIVVE